MTPAGIPVGVFLGQFNTGRVKWKEAAILDANGLAGGFVLQERTSGHVLGIKKLQRLPVGVSESYGLMSESLTRVVH